MPIILAHGAVGILDELFPFIALAIFACLMAAPVLIAVLRNRAHKPQSDGGSETKPVGENTFRLE